QDSQHVILFGERAVGKTSLANVLSYKLSDIGSYILAPHVNCIAQDTFSDIWERVFAEIKEKLETSGYDIAGPLLDSLNASAPVGAMLTPDVIRRLLTEIGKECLLILIIDEFDTVESDDARQ